jgi:hypothetical protein
MTIEQTAGKLAAWRDLATAAGRAEDAEALAIALKIVQDEILRSRPARERAAAGRTGEFIPRGQRVDSDKAEPCPWTHAGGCPNCTIEREHPFITDSIPGRAFMCPTFLFSKHNHKKEFK